MIPTNYEGSVINALPSMGVTTLVHSSCAFKLAFKLFLLYDKGAGGYAIGSHLGSTHTEMAVQLLVVSGPKFTQNITLILKFVLLEWLGRVYLLPSWCELSFIIDCTI